MNNIPKVISETILYRGWSDFKDRLGSVWFWVAELLVGALAAVLYEDPILIVVAVLSLGVAVAIAATITAPLRQRDDARKIAEIMIPKFKLEFEHSPAYVHRTFVGSPDNPVPVFYVRVLPVLSCPTLLKCRGFLTDIERLNMDTSKFEKTRFSGTDSLQLQWSILDNFKPLDLFKGINRFLNILSTRSDTGKLHYLVPGIPKRIY